MASLAKEPYNEDALMLKKVHIQYIVYDRGVIMADTRLYLVILFKKYIGMDIVAIFIL